MNVKAVRSISFWVLVLILTVMLAITCAVFIGHVHAQDDPPSNPPDIAGVGTNVSWAGNVLVYTVDDGNLVLYQYNPRLRTFGPWLHLPVGGIVANITLSQDGSKLAFSTDICGPVDYVAYIYVGVGSHTLHCLTPGTNPRWSPDGTQITYVGVENDGPKNINVFNVNQAEERTVYAGYAYTPSWSPDGRWIAYVIWSSNENQIWITDPNGSAHHKITLGFHPSWSPDGQWLIYANSDPGGTSHLQAIKVNQEDAQPMTFSELVYPLPQMNPALSFDGQWLSFSSNEDTYVVPTPVELTHTAGNLFIPIQGNGAESQPGEELP